MWVHIQYIYFFFFLSHHQSNLQPLETYCVCNDLSPHPERDRAMTLARLFHASITLPFSLSLSRLCSPDVAFICTQMCHRKLGEYGMSFPCWGVMRRGMKTVCYGTVFPRRLVLWKTGQRLGGNDNWTEREGDEVVLFHRDMSVTVNVALTQPASPLTGCLCWHCRKGTAKTLNRKYLAAHQDVLKKLSGRLFKIY